MMERLTSNKPIPDMNMLELAYNSCYLDKERKARYRNYELDIDSRELAKDLVEDMCDEDLSDMSDEEFDEYMSEMRSVEMDSQIGLLALFYRNLWVMADLREKLKEYEDLEEQGRLIKLPCKIGDEVYNITWWDDVQEKVVVKGKTYYRTIHKHKVSKSAFGYTDIEEIGKTVFLTRKEAEAKLKELRGNKDE